MGYSTVAAEPQEAATATLALDGKKSMIQQTVERLLHLASPKQFWVITNEELRPAIAKQPSLLPKNQLVAEPAPRNTAPAIGLAAFCFYGRIPTATLALFPADHVIGDEERFREMLGRGIKIAAAGADISRD